MNIPSSVPFQLSVFHPPRLFLLSWRSRPLLLTIEILIASAATKEYNMIQPMTLQQKLRDDSLASSFGAVSTLQLMVSSSTDTSLDADMDTFASMAKKELFNLPRRRTRDSKPIWSDTIESIAESVIVEAHIHVVCFSEKAEFRSWQNLP
jgi:hypothetical protein